MADLTAEVDWDAVRRAAIIRMVASEPGIILADGNALVTCGAHSGHSMMAVAFCRDAVWAEAIAAAIADRLSS